MVLGRFRRTVLSTVLNKSKSINFISIKQMEKKIITKNSYKIIFYNLVTRKTVIFIKKISIYNKTTTIMYIK